MSMLTEIQAKVLKMEKRKCKQQGIKLIIEVKSGRWLGEEPGKKDKPRVVIRQPLSSVPNEVLKPKNQVVDYSNSGSSMSFKTPDSYS